MSTLTMQELLESFRELDTNHKLLCVAGGVAVTVVSTVVIKKLLHKYAINNLSGENQPVERKIYPRDTVILHQIGRGPYAPSLTPFAVKLETYLRMARIPYQNVHEFKSSSKGKVPWIEYNGEPVADSTLCIDFLNKKLGIDLNKHLLPAERGIAQSMQVMVEEHLYWMLVLFRWQYDNDKTMIDRIFKVPKIFWWIMKKRISKHTWAQGLGRHTAGEITQMMYNDFKALSVFLGDKKFLFGDEPCENDCAVFGQLSQFYWHFVGTGHETILQDKYPNLAAYCERMKTAFWPDWDDCNTKGSTVKALK